MIYIRQNCAKMTLSNAWIPRLNPFSNKKLGTILAFYQNGQALNMKINVFLFFCVFAKKQIISP